jgi:hypothetical protein
MQSTDNLTVKQAAEFIGVRVRDVQKACSSGRLPGVRKRRGDWTIPRVVAANWARFARPVGRPGKPVPVLPLDVNPYQLREVLGWAVRYVLIEPESVAEPVKTIVGTYEDVIEIAQEFAPERTAALDVRIPVKTAGELSHIGASEVQIEIADLNPKGRTKTGFRRNPALRARLHFHPGTGPGWLNPSQIRNLPPDVREAREKWLTETGLILETSN